MRECENNNYIIFKGVDFMLKTNVTAVAEVMAASERDEICKCFMDYEEALAHAEKLSKYNKYNYKYLKAENGDTITVLEGICDWSNYTYFKSVVIVPISIAGTTMYEVAEYDRDNITDRYRRNDWEYGDVTLAEVQDYFKRYSTEYNGIDYYVSYDGKVHTTDEVSECEDIARACEKYDEEGYYEGTDPAYLYDCIHFDVEGLSDEEIDLIAYSAQYGISVDNIKHYQDNGYVINNIVNLCDDDCYRGLMQLCTKRTADIIEAIRYNKIGETVDIDGVIYEVETEEE